MNGSLGPLYISHGLMVSSILVSCIATGMLDVWMFVCFLAVQFLDTIYTILYLKIFKWKKWFFLFVCFFSVSSYLAFMVSIGGATKGIANVWQKGQTSFWKN